VRLLYQHPDRISRAAGTQLIEPAQNCRVEAHELSGFQPMPGPSLL
jgi:hypothetical protein